VFDDDQIDSYIELKMAEVMRFEHTPHPVEFDMYYSDSSDWVPIGWLAMFDPRDVQVVEEPVESDTYDPDTRTLCPTLIRKRDAALEALARRRERLAKILPPQLELQLHGLEAAVSACKTPYIQVVLSDLDSFASYRGSERLLRDLVATLDGDNAKQWRAMLAPCGHRDGQKPQQGRLLAIDGCLCGGGFPAGEILRVARGEKAGARERDAGGQGAGLAACPPTGGARQRCLSSSPRPCPASGRGGSSGRPKTAVGA
jgi:hypothetical protein